MGYKIPMMPPALSSYTTRTFEHAGAPRTIYERGEGPPVLVMTEIPQITPDVAAFADRHYQVEKQVADGRTSTALNLLDEEDRVEEMARMLGGSKVSDATREHARELIRLSSTNITIGPTGD